MVIVSPVVLKYCYIFFQTRVGNESLLYVDILQSRPRTRARPFIKNSTFLLDIWIQTEPFNLTCINIRTGDECFVPQWTKNVC